MCVPDTEPSTLTTKKRATSTATSSATSPAEPSSTNSISSRTTAAPTITTTKTTNPTTASSSPSATAAPEKKHTFFTTPVIAIIAGGGSGAFLVMVVACYFCHRKRQEGRALLAAYSDPDRPMYAKPLRNSSRRSYSSSVRPSYSSETSVGAHPADLDLYKSNVRVSYYAMSDSPTTNSELDAMFMMPPVSPAGSLNRHGGPAPAYSSYAEIYAIPPPQNVLPTRTTSLAMRPLVHSPVERSPQWPSEMLLPEPQMLLPVPPAPVEQHAGPTRYPGTADDGVSGGGADNTGWDENMPGRAA